MLDVLLAANTGKDDAINTPAMAANDWILDTVIPPVCPCLCESQHSSSRHVPISHANLFLTNIGFMFLNRGANARKTDVQKLKEHARYFSAPHR